MSVVDLNADVGEWDIDGASDVALIPSITSANVACGVHAGNDAVMAITVARCAMHEVSVGAHPSLDDRAGFGRRERVVVHRDLRKSITVQIARLAEIALRQGVALSHVKPHGALYNMSARDPAIAETVAGAVADFGRTLVLVGLAASESIRAATHAGLRTASEGFVDRAYLPNGSLAPRDPPGAVLQDARLVADRAVRMVRDREVAAIDGSIIPLSADTICIHGDTPGAPVIAEGVRAALELAGVRVTARRH